MYVVDVIAIHGQLFGNKPLKERCSPFNGIIIVFTISIYAVRSGISMPRSCVKSLTSRAEKAPSN